MLGPYIPNMIGSVNLALIYIVHLVMISQLLMFIKQTDRHTIDSFLAIDLQVVKKTIPTWEQQKFQPATIMLKWQDAQWDHDEMLSIYTYAAAFDMDI